MYREAVSRGEGVLRKDFCQVMMTPSTVHRATSVMACFILLIALSVSKVLQVAHSNKFLILASSADAPGSNDAALTPTIPLQRLVTFYVVRFVNMSLGV